MQGKNIFNKGLNTDMHPEFMPDGFLSKGSKNLRYKTDSDNQVILQKLAGLAEIPDDSGSDTEWPSNAFPSNLKFLAAKETEGVSYILSHVNDSDEIELGSFPGVVLKEGGLEDSNDDSGTTFDASGLIRIEFDKENIDFGVVERGETHNEPLSVHNPTSKGITVEFANYNTTAIFPDSKYIEPGSTADLTAVISIPDTEQEFLDVDIAVSITSVDDVSSTPLFPISVGNINLNALIHLPPYLL